MPVAALRVHHPDANGLPARGKRQRATPPEFPLPSFFQLKKLAFEADQHRHDRGLKGIGRLAIEAGARGSGRISRARQRLLILAAQGAAKKLQPASSARSVWTMVGRFDPWRLSEPQGKPIATIFSLSLSPTIHGLGRFALNGKNHPDRGQIVHCRNHALKNPVGLRQGHVLVIKESHGVRQDHGLARHAAGSFWRTMVSS